MNPHTASRCAVQRVLSGDGSAEAVQLCQRGLRAQCEHDKSGGAEVPLARKMPDHLERSEIVDEGGSGYEGYLTPQCRPEGCHAWEAKFLVHLSAQDNLHISRHAHVSKCTFRTAISIPHSALLIHISALLISISALLHSVPAMPCHA